MKIIIVQDKDGDIFTHKAEGFDPNESLCAEYAPYQAMEVEFIPTKTFEWIPPSGGKFVERKTRK